MRLVAILSIVAIVGLLGGLWLATTQTGSDDQFASCRGTSIAGGPGAIGGPFELVNRDGETVTIGGITSNLKRCLKKTMALYRGVSKESETVRLKM